MQLDKSEFHSLDDQQSVNMNVSMDPSSTRVAVIGGGPGGLCAAAGLLKLGYKHVTVLEQNETVGGMCASLVVDDRVYDLGGQVLAREGCPTVMSMVRAFDLQVEMEDMSHQQHAKIDFNTGRYEDLNVGRDFVAMMALTFELQAKAKATGKLGIHAVSAFSHEPTPAFMRKNGLSDLPDAIATLYTASGYGFVEDVPYAYVHEFIRTSMLGKLWRVKGGYGSLWNKVAQNLPDVRCNVKVRSIDRSSNDVVRISVVQSSTPSQETVLEFDKVILTGSLPIPKRNRTYRSALSAHDDQDEPKPREEEDVLDSYSDEEQLFSKVQTMEYYTTAVTISGLDVPAGFYLPESAIHSTTMGHIAGLQRFFGDTDVYIIWSYGNAQCDQQRMTEMLHDDVRKMGGRVESVLLQRKWVYCPHVNSQEMADGFYDKLDNLQGKRNTYYLGSLLAFEATERNSSLALNLVRRFFGPSGNHSRFDKTFTEITQHHPAIKNLMPAPLDEHEAAARFPTKKLTEIPGVSFPELPSIDAYVSFYGRHKVHRDRIVYRWVNDKGEESDSLSFGQLDSRVSIIAQRLVTGEASLKPGDRVLMVYQPGLEFIEAFFGCVRARVLPVPVIPPDPTKPYDQALIKVASVTKVSDAKAILSTASYHNVVRASSWRTAVFGQKAPPAKITAAVGPPPQWPDLPWHHTDTWTRGSIKELGLLAWATSKANNGSAKEETVVANDHFSTDDSIEMKARMRNDPKIEKGNSSILGVCDNSSEIDELVPRNCAGSEPKPSDLCFLQFTSGSTGDPKGVMITHGGLLHNLHYLKTLYNCTSRTVGIQWLPQYHDMGLIGGVLSTLFQGACSVLFSPATFIRKPLLWLELMERYKGTHVAAPNFAFELILKRYESLRSKPPAPGKEHKNYDLSSLHFIMSGAEPVRPSTTRRFLELFYNSGLRESMFAMGYGLAECCVLVSTSYGKSKPLLVDGDGRLCVGYTCHGDPDMDVRIVNTETFEEQPEGIEGELWVCSPSNGVGYWGLAELSKQTFANEISKSSDGKKFLRTGDLGRVISGHIFVTGRAKDLIIIQGRNIYPSDIEKTVESCSDDVRPGCSAAISAPQKILKSKGMPQYQNSSEQDDELVDSCVVVVAEVRDEKNLDANIELESRIKSAVASEHGINVAYVDLIKPRSIPKTTSGKIRRGECLKRFSEGTLLSVKLPDFHSGSKIAQRRRLKNDIISRKKSRSYQTSPCSCQGALKPPVVQPIGNKETLMEFLVGLVAKKTKLSATEVSVKEGLSNYSLTSLESVSMAQEISEYLGVHIPPLELYTASCIEELADNCLAFLHNAGLKWSPNTETLNYVDNRSTHSSHPPNPLEINENFEIELISNQELMSAIEPSVSQQFLVTVLQVLGLLFIAALLLIPAATIYDHVLSFLSTHQKNSRLTSTFLAIALVPAAWMVYIGVVGVTICLTVKILRPNYAVQSAIPLWSARYVRWWTLYRLQDFASKSLAAHLRGTVFLVWWYRLMGAQIGNNVHIDTTEITDPWLLYIGNGTVVEEDATLQSHDVRAGAVHFQPIKIGSRCVVGSFSVVQMGTRMGAGSRIGTLCKSQPGQLLRSQKQSNSRVDSMDGVQRTLDIPVRQLCAVYLQGLISTISALLAYAAFWSFRPTFLSSGAKESSEIHALEAETSLLFTLALTFPWALSIVAPITLLSRHDPAQIFDILMNLNSRLPALLLSLGASFVVYGIVIGALTSATKWCLIGNPRSRRDGTDHQLPIERIQSTTLVVHGLLRSAHQKFFVLLAGTEALCIYLRNLGAQIGSSVSIRKVNALIDPDFLSLGDGCHLGDFSRFVTTKITRSDETNAMLITSDVVRVGSGCVVGAQSVVLPGATMENESVLGAMSVAPDAIVLQEGGVYVGGREGNANVMISRQSNSVDLRVEGMDRIYRQIVAKLATRIAKTTVTSTENGRRVRFFHRTGVAGRGTLRVFDDLPGLPEAHELFSPGHSYPVVVRHSNALSGSDDRCPDAKGAALRILHPNSAEDVDLPLLDLVMNTGKCLHARNMLDLMSWDAKSREAQEKYVQENPRIGEILWGLIKAADSYAEVHYYSVFARLFRSNLRSSELSGSKPRSATEDSNYFVKFCLRPSDRKFDASHGSVTASAALPPQQGYLPASPGDKRSTEYLREEFKQRLQTKEGAKYILQLQKHKVPESTEEVNDVLDPKVAWDEDECPFVDVAELSLNTLIADEVAEKMTFNSRNGGPGVAVVPATSATDSASIDHCRSVLYDIAQTIRKGLPLPGAWKDLVRAENLDLTTEKLHDKLDEKTGPAAGCPMMSPLLKAQSLNQAPDRNNTFSTLGLEMTFMKLLQPLLQVTVPVTLLVLSAYPIVLAMAYLASKAGQKRWMAMFPFMIPVAYVAAGVAFALTSVCCRWVRFGRYQGGESTELWSWHTLWSTVWDALVEVLRGTFLELVKGSLLYNAFLRLLGASIGRGVYIDSLNVLNPAQLRIGAGSTVGRNALFFGHLYEPGRKVFYKSNVVGDYCTIGTQALMLPGSQLDDGSDLEALELGMKDEVIASYK